MILRNQARNKVFSAINIFGLAIGFAVSILIINYVSFENSFDKMHAKYDRIYRVESRFYEDNRMTDDWATSSFGYGSAISAEMTGIEDYVRIGMHNTEQTVICEEKRIPGHDVVYTEPSFFTVFDFELKKGAGNDQLQRPNTVVITEEVARRFFSNDDPIGKVLTFASGSNFLDCEVTGVLADFPANSHVRFSYLISYGSLPDFLKETWYWHEAYTYLLLSPGKDPKEIEDQFPKLAERYKTRAGLRNKTWGISLVPIEQIHLNPQKPYETEIKGNKKSLVILVLIAGIVFLTAWINYINLIVVRSMERAKDVGIRKVAGAFPRQLISQYLMESLVITSLAVMVGIVLVVSLKPVFNQIMGENIDLLILDQPLFWLFSVVLLSAGILLSGFYPAFVMRRIKPSVILKGNYFNSGSAGVIRQVLVIFQFSAALFLICGTFIIYKQVKFMQKQNPGIDINQTIVLKFPVSRENLAQKMVDFAEDLEQESLIGSVTLAGAVPGMEIGSSASCRLAGAENEQDRLCEILTVDEQFITTFGFKLLAGRSFQSGFGNERENLVINESALETLGFQKPEDAIGNKVLLAGGTNPVTIIGVVKDWHQRGLRNAYTPVMFVLNGRLGWVPPQFIAIKTADTGFDTILARLKKRWESFFPESAFDYFFLDHFFDNQYRMDRRLGKIVSIFTGLAFFISVLGLWTLTAFIASKKVKEVGVRKVLGAQTASILLLFSKEIIVLILVALIIASPLSVWVMKNWLTNYAFRTNISWQVYFCGGLITMIIAMFTVSWQSWKSATGNPVDALRHE